MSVPREPGNRFRLRLCFVRAVRAGEAKLCGRVRDASSDAEAACGENILVPPGLLRELKCCCARGFCFVLVSLLGLEGLFECPARGFYGLLFVLTAICMGFKALLRESLFECLARGFYDLLLFIAIICIGLKAFPSYYYPARGFYSFFVVLAVN